MKLLKVLRGLAVACGVVAAVNGAQAAGDEPDKFNGLYAGLVSGIGFTDGSWADGSFPPVSTNLDLDGGLAGITAGYNWRHNDLLFGVEADITTMGLGQNNIPCGALATCSVDMDAMATIRARLGWVFGSTGQFSVYATGGLANVWLDTVSPGAGPGAKHSDLTYAVGGGFEGYVMDTNWISTKVEFLYVGLDVNKSFNAPVITVVSGPDRIRLEDLFVARWGWNVHF